MVQLERLSNSEIQKLYAEHKAKGKSLDPKHLERLRQRQEETRGQHHGRSRYKYRG